MTERPTDCGDLLQKNCAIETEEWLSLLYKVPLFHWNAAALFFQTDIFSDAVLWRCSGDAGGILSNAMLNNQSNQFIEMMHSSFPYCPVSTKRNALDRSNLQISVRRLN